MPKSLKISEEDLEYMLKKWPRPIKPVYRFAKCWKCGKTLFFGMWHVFFRKEQREAHICRQCGRPYEVDV